jgi:hypothetical protein
VLERFNWTIVFSWIKAHIGIYGNELADRLAKDAARNRDTMIAFNKIPKSTLYSEIEEEGNQKSHKERERCTNSAIPKQFFAHVQDRLKLKINITPVFAVMVTGHGKTSAYVHRFNLMEHATCVCNKGDQAIDHLINPCKLLQTQRELLKSNVLKSGNWPVSKFELITKHMKSSQTFIKSIGFDQLQ